MIAKLRCGLKEELSTKLKLLFDKERDEEMLCDLVDIRLNCELEKDEIYWEQHARTNWLKGGDKNTKFFHSQASLRKMMNTVKCLESINGQVTTIDFEMVEITKSFFEDLFTA